jgi:hypothetical protein
MQARLPSNVENPAPTLKLDGNGAWWCNPQDYSGFGLKSQIPTPKSAQLEIEPNITKLYSLRNAPVK